jgi:hypothetical protein
MSSSHTADAITPVMPAAVEILRHQLELLHVRSIFEKRSLLSQLVLDNWKMNLLAVSPDGHTLFIGSHSKIIMMPLSAAGIPRVIEDRIPTRTLTRIQGNEIPMHQNQEWDSDISQQCSVECTDTVNAIISAIEEVSESADLSESARIAMMPPRNEDVSSLYTELTLPSIEVAEDLPAQPAEINALRIGYIGWRPVLVVVCMSGHSCLFDLQRLSMHQRFGSGRAVTALISHTISAEPDVYRLNVRTRWQDNSAWSLAFSPRGALVPIVAIGSNAARAFLWKPASALTDAQIAAAGRATYVPSGHNVPSVDVDSSGQFIALSSIDTVLRIARLDGSAHEAEIVASKDVDHLWGWSVRWIPHWSIRQRSCTLIQMKEHREHAPLSDKIASLRPNAVGVPIPHDNPMLDQLINQLMRDFGDNFPPAAAHALRADLRAGLAHIVALQPDQRMEEEEAEEDEPNEDGEADEIVLEDDDDDDVEGDEDAEGHVNRPDEDMPPELAEDTEIHATDAHIPASAPTAAEMVSPSDATSEDSEAPHKHTSVDRSSDLLVYCSKSHLYLMDSSLHGQ